MLSVASAMSKMLSQSSFFECLIDFAWRTTTNILQAIAICGAFTKRFKNEIINNENSSGISRK